MFYTLTANPAIDYNISCDGMAPDRVIRTRDAVYTPNGKGLNVSFTLGHFGIASTILGFFAGFSGRYIVEGARERGCRVLPIWTAGITRVNVFVDAGMHEYNLVGAGAAITRADELRMLGQLRSAEDMTCLVVSGSLPPGVSEGFLSEVVCCAQAHGADVVFDISSEKLAGLLGFHPLLIKPNNDELKSIFGFEVAAGDDAAAACALDALFDMGASAVLLTLGEGGSYFGDGAHIWHARCTEPVQVLSTACAGDASLGAFLSVWYSDRSRVEDALRLAMGTGAAVVECAGLGDLSRVGELSDRVQVHRVR